MNCSILSKLFNDENQLTKRLMSSKALSSFFSTLRVNLRTMGGTWVSFLLLPPEPPNAKDKCEKVLLRIDMLLGEVLPEEDANEP